MSSCMQSQIIYICDGSIKEKKSYCSLKSKKKTKKKTQKEQLVKSIKSDQISCQIFYSSLSKSFCKYLLSTNGPGSGDTHTLIAARAVPKPSFHLLKNICGFPNLQGIKWADLQLLTSPSGHPQTPSPALHARPGALVLPQAHWTCFHLQARGLLS